MQVDYIFFTANNTHVLIFYFRNNDCITLNWKFWIIEKKMCIQWSRAFERNIYSQWISSKNIKRNLLSFNENNKNM